MQKSTKHKSKNGHFTEFKMLGQSQKYIFFKKKPKQREMEISWLWNCIYENDSGSVPRFAE